MENKNGMVLDDNSLENASGGLWLCNKFKQKHYPVDSNGNIDYFSSGCRDKSMVEAYNDERNISNKKINKRQLNQLRHGINPFEKQG